MKWLETVTSDDVPSKVLSAVAYQKKKKFIRQHANFKMLDEPGNNACCMPNRTVQ